jgi:hypothetical protein
MTRLEYKVMDAHRDVITKRMLDDLGSEGWELVSAARAQESFTFFFKRIVAVPADFVCSGCRCGGRRPGPAPVSAEFSRPESYYDDIFSKAANDRTP